MVKEAYCSFEVAKLLKEKGFELDTSKDYWKIGEDGTMYFMSSIGAYTSNPNDEYAFYRPENSYPCPTHQMAMKWLRETRDIVISIFPTIETDMIVREDYNYAIYKNKTVVYQSCSTSYEEAVETAIKYCLENLI